MLRDPNLQKITSIEQLVRYAISADHVQPALKYLNATDGAGVTLIIDGFDELSNELRSTSFIRELIEGDILPNARVVVTSRPSASACLHQYVDRRIEVLGFDKSSKEQYINDALKNYPTELKTLKLHFQVYPNIDAMCYIPLNMAIIVFLCLLGSLPPTATEMFESFIVHTVCYHLKRSGNAFKERIKDIKKLPQPIQQALKQLQKIAFDGLLADKVVFTIDDLSDMSRDDPTYYGLLQSVECYCADEIGTTTKSFNFLHLGMQEYFAANYVATSLEGGEVYALLSESFLITNHPLNYNIRLSNMWIMYCGITKGEHVKHYIKNLNWFLSLTASVFEKLSADVIHDIDIDNTSVSNSSVVSDDDYSPNSSVVLSNYSPVSSVLLSGYSLVTGIVSHDEYYTPPETPPSTSDDDNDSNLFDYQIIPAPSNTPDPSFFGHSYLTQANRFLSKNYSQETLSAESISLDILRDARNALYLFQCFQEAQDDIMCDHLTKSFDTGKISLITNGALEARGSVKTGEFLSLLPHQVVSLGFFLSKSRRNWKELDLCQCSIGDRGINVLHRYLYGDKSYNQKIATINLSHNDLSGASSSLIGDIISHIQSSTVLLFNNCITDVKNISDALIGTSTLKVLDISENGLTPQEALAISDMMKIVEELNLSYNNFGDDGAVILSKGIMHTRTLKVFSIKSNKITATGISAIAMSLLCNTSLENLDMSYNTVEDNGAMAIAQLISSNHTLKQLCICNSRIQTTGAAAIAGSLQHNTSLEILDMSYNAVEKLGAISIAQAFTVNNTLRKLLLIDDRTIDEELAMTIVENLCFNKCLIKLGLPSRVQFNDRVLKIVENINNLRRNCNVQELIVEFPENVNVMAWDIFQCNDEDNTI